MEKTIENFMNFMQDCVDNEERIIISVICGNSHFTDSFIPENNKIKKQEIYITGDWAILNIEGDYNISYDEIDKLYIISQGEVKYLIGN